ncbi:hypothetical protein CYQ88_04555 [Hydrogenovibrio sp. SC-1]|uniref:BrxA family protein n=1 Tax=Hydrogenovibrio sp. SC-1 TaxID=2065820 RepID=UPI000C7E782D|nr:BrxA family protein [Hydrogenovibrio sp. SC-1]PLA74868.1 hypothetical protein CYQ88_04555 [Hydrogenovibrio sp. SC-1]
MLKEYIKDITAGALLLDETKLWLSLTENGRQVDIETFLKAMPARSESTAKRYASVIKGRLSNIDEVGLELLTNSYGENLKLMLLLLVMNRTPIVKDFIKEIYCESKKLYRSTVDAIEVNRFIEERIDLISAGRLPSESSLKKVKTNLVKVLVNAELLNNNRVMMLQNIFILPEVQEFASTQKLTHLLNILECES